MITDNERGSDPMSHYINSHVISTGFSDYVSVDNGTTGTFVVLQAGPTQGEVPYTAVLSASEARRIAAALVSGADYADRKDTEVAGQ